MKADSVCFTETSVAWNSKIIIYILIPIVLIFLLGSRIVRPTQRALTERLGKYNRFANPGYHWIIPFIEHMHKVNITEMMIDAERIPDPRLVLLAEVIPIVEYLLPRFKRFSVASTPDTIRVERLEKWLGKVKK